MTIVEDQKVKIRWNNANKKRFTEFGYEFTKSSDEFFVDIKHISKGSKWKVMAACDNCGETVSKTPSQLKKTKNYFCSHGCADAHRSRSMREDRECIICNTPFNVRKSSKVKMCSIKCQGVWQSQNLRGENANNYKHGERVKVK